MKKKSFLRGNSNNFEDREDCARLCEGSHSVAGNATAVGGGGGGMGREDEEDDDHMEEHGECMGIK